MSERKATMELVKMARQQLLDRGEIPSDNKIYKLLGFGSISTINPLNRKLREIERQEKLAREINIPMEIRTVFAETVAQRVNEDTAAISESLQETEQALQETVEQLATAITSIETLEKELEGAQVIKAKLNETIAKQTNEREVAESALNSTIAERTAAMEKNTQEREVLLEQIRKLSNTESGLAETVTRLKAEANDLKQKSHDLERQLSDMRAKAAVAERECSLLRENIAEKDSRIREQALEVKELRAHMHRLQEGVAKGREATKKRPPSPPKKKSGVPAQKPPASP